MSTVNLYQDTSLHSCWHVLSHVFREKEIRRLDDYQISHQKSANLFNHSKLASVGHFSLSSRLCLVFFLNAYLDTL